MAYGFTAGPVYGATSPTTQGIQGTNPPAESYQQSSYGVPAPPPQSGAGATRGGSTSAPTTGTPNPGGSPVLSNGLIPPPQPAPAPAPAPAPTPAPPPLTTAQREAAIGIEDRGNNMVYVPAYGGLVDRNNPIYVQAMAAAPPAGSPGGGGGAAGGGYDPTKLQTSPAPTYTPATFSQFTNPTFPGIDQATDGLMMGVLNNPLTMSPQHVSMLQEQGKEGILAQQAALMQALTQQRAQSGFAPGGGMEQAGMRRISDATGSALTDSNRDIELAKLDRDRNDILQAIQSGSAYQGNRLNQGIQAYGASLQGQQAQAGQDYQGYASEADAYNNANDLAMRAQALALQKSLGEGGLANEGARLAESSRQYNLGNQLNWAQLMEQMFGNRSNLGLGYAQLGQNAQTNMFNTVFNPR